MDSQGFEIQQPKRPYPLTKQKPMRGDYDRQKVPQMQAMFLENSTLENEQEGRAEERISFVAGALFNAPRG